MEMTGEYSIAAPRQVVWDALNDPEILKRSIPGCTEMIKTADDAFEAKVSFKIGPVRAKFGGKVKLSDVDPPNGYTISGEGQGGPAGFAKGGATVKLRDDGAGTMLSYTVNAAVGGKLAQIGSRLIDATAKKMAKDFFARFAEAVAGEAPEEAVEAAPAVAAKPGLPPAIWVGGLIAVVVVLLLLFAI